MKASADFFQWTILYPPVSEHTPLTHDGPLLANIHSQTMLIAASLRELVALKHTWLVTRLRQEYFNPQRKKGQRGFSCANTQTKKASLTDVRGVTSAGVVRGI